MRSPAATGSSATDGSVEMLTATASAEMGIGDRFVIETPGGGGFGKEGA